MSSRTNRSPTGGQPQGNGPVHSEKEPLLGSEAEVPEEDEGLRRLQAQNVIRMIVIISFTMIGYGVFYSAYGQWIYVHFEKEALGANFSHLNVSATRDPCFRSNHSHASPFKKQLQEAQANSAQFGVYTLLCSLVPSFFTNMLLGAYADQLGRRLIFIVPIAGGLVRCALCWAVANFELNVYFILVGNVINGLCGEIVGLFMAVFLYTADNTSKGSSRSFGMVLAQMVISVAMYFTQMASGYFIEAAGYVWPMFTGMIISAVMLVVCFIFLRETLDKSKALKMSACQRVKGVFSFYFEKPEDPKYKRSDFIILGCVFFLFGSSLGSDIKTLYLMNEPFCWGAKKLGYVSSISGLVISIGSAVLMKMLQKIMSDEFVCVVCLLSTAAQRYFLSFSSADWMIYVAYTIGIMESPSLPIVRGILSKMVRPEIRGSLFASVAVIEVATVAVAGSGMTEVYAATVGAWRGLAYFVLGCIISLSAVLMLLYTLVVVRRQKTVFPDVVEDPAADVRDTRDKEKRSRGTNPGRAARPINGSATESEAEYVY